MKSRKDNKGRNLRVGESQRADGAYMYRYVDSSGVRRTIYSWKLVNTDKIPMGKRECTALRELEKQITIDLYDGIKTAEANQTSLDMMFDIFLRARQDLSVNTRCNYTNLYNGHIKKVMGYKPLNLIKASDISRLYNALIYDEGMALSSIEGIHSAVFQIFEMAVNDNILKKNPSANALKKIRKTYYREPKKRDALTEKQQSRFIEFVYKTPMFRSWGALFTVLLGTGLRIGEALGLRWEDCDFNNNIIDVSHTLHYKMNENGKCEYRITRPKTTAGLRSVPMFNDVKKVLLEKKEVYKPSDFKVDGYSNFIFLNSSGKVFGNNAVFDVLQRIVETYNRQEYFDAKEEHREPCFLPKLSAHLFRHTFCTRLCENEVNIKVIQDVMGHKNIHTTMDVYSTVTHDKKLTSFADVEGKIKLM